MKTYHLEDFREDDAWLVFRLDTQVKDQAVDIYMLMDLPGGLLLGQEIASDTLSAEQATTLLKQGRIAKGRLPRRLLLPKGDPAELSFRRATETLQLGLETPPTRHLEALIAPVKESFGREFFSPSSIGYAAIKDDADEMDRESAKQMVPDSYDPCSCASGQKFKFCCKPIFREIMGAMMAAEGGRKSEALDWIAKAKGVVGETAEVLCREAIVLSFFDPEKSEKVLERCLAMNPRHPRANYIRGISLKEHGDLKGAVAAYEVAIANYPKTDRFHLNESYNNLGTAYYEMGDYPRAKTSWEQGLVTLPSDKTVR